MAARWEGAGAQWLHLVDLDGAFNKKPRNVDGIRRILDEVNIPVQLGGGIRDEKTIDFYLKLGVRRVIIGTEAVRRPEWIVALADYYPDRIVAGIDVRNGKAAIDGWTETTEVGALELAQRFNGSGLAALVVTDINRDGMQTGNNLELTRRLAEKSEIPVIASGGISSLEDIAALLPLEPLGVVGVITGKALYSGTLALDENSYLWVHIEHTSNQVVQKLAFPGQAARTYHIQSRTNILTGTWQDEQTGIPG